MAKEDIPGIADFDLQWRGWYFPAHPTTDDDEMSFPSGDGGPSMSPDEPEQFTAWRDAGEPRNEEDLERYGFKRMP